MKYELKKAFILNLVSHCNILSIAEKNWPTYLVVRSYAISTAKYFFL